MSIVIANKLPHGLTITHNGEILNLNGANVGADPLNPLGNGSDASGGQRSAGYGLTTLNDKQAAAYEDWETKVTKDANGGPLAEPFQPLANGSILKFKNEQEARKETEALSSAVTTGFEGLDADAELDKATKDQPGLEVERTKK